MTGNLALGMAFAPHRRAATARLAGLAPTAPRLCVTRCSASMAHVSPFLLVLGIMASTVNVKGCGKAHAATLPCAH